MKLRIFTIQLAVPQNLHSVSKEKLHTTRLRCDVGRGILRKRLVPNSHSSAAATADSSMSPAMRMGLPSVTTSSALMQLAYRLSGIRHPIH